MEQGDTLSSFLFLVVMEAVLRKLKKRWQALNERRRGNYYWMVIDSPNDVLSNLRFADDVLLIASSRADVAKMISDLAREAAKFGLEIHLGKTRILTNKGGKRPSHIKCYNHNVEVVAADSTEKYLGRALTMVNQHDAELQNRLASAWAPFFKSKSALCNRRLLLKDRLRLFEAVVTPCALYSCGTWAMTTDMARSLRSARRRMLRWMMPTLRRQGEGWPEYITRATERVEDIATKNRVSDWVALQQVRKGKLAGQAASHTNGRWTSRILQWKPWFRCISHRDVGHPIRRWEDPLVDVAGGSWPDAAKDAELWAALCMISA